jgi:integrase
MSSSTTSRGALPAHLEAVFQQIVADTALTSRQRDDIASGFRTFSKEVGRPLRELPAHPRTLRERPARFMPDAASLNVAALKRFKRRWANTLSLMRFALKHVGIAGVTRRSRVAYAPGWKALFRLFTDRYAQISLCRLARFCSARGIGPERVDDAIFGALLDQLTADGVDRLPRKIHQKEAVAWNRWAATVPAWPGQPVTVPDYRRTYALPWTVFPASLKADVHAYLGHLAGTDILAERDFRPLVAASIRTRTQQIRAFISALVHRGIDPQTLHGLHDVVGVETVKIGLRFFLDRAPAESTEQACGIARVITGLARHWVKVDPPHLAALRAICKRIDPGYQGMSEKNIGRLAQFDDLANLRKLHDLPGVLVAIASGDKPSPAGALLVQTAVAVELLMMVPMRRKNLARLEIGRHLIRSGGTTRIAIPAHEIKNGVPIEALVLPHLVRLIDLYRTSYRPLLLTEPSNFLFPGVANRPKSGERLALQISNCVKDRCGLLMNVHLFRHFSAGSWLEKHPGDYGSVRLLLGHKSMETTTRYYCGMETKAAMLHFDEHVLKLRTSLALPPTPGQLEPGL